MTLSVSPPASHTPRTFTVSLGKPQSPSHKSLGSKTRSVEFLEAGRSLPGKPLEVLKVGVPTINSFPSPSSQHRHPLKRKMTQKYQPNYNHHNPPSLAGNRIHCETATGVPASHQWGEMTGCKTTYGDRAFLGSVRRGSQKANSGVLT